MNVFMQLMRFVGYAFLAAMFILGYIILWPLIVAHEIAKSDGWQDAGDFEGYGLFLVFGSLLIAWLLFLFYVMMAILGIF